MGKYKKKVKVNRCEPLNVLSVSWDCPECKGLNQERVLKMPDISQCWKCECIVKITCD